MGNRVVIFGSYNKGPEYQEKLEKVEKLKQEGIHANLFYLLALTSDDALPNKNVDFLMTNNIEKAIDLFNPNILAFHNGLTLSLKNEEFVIAINNIKKSYPTMIYLIEHLNRTS